jgi:hypothetical protein
LIQEKEKAKQAKAEAHKGGAQKLSKTGSPELTGSSHSTNDASLKLDVSEHGNLRLKSGLASSGIGAMAAAAAARKRSTQPKNNAPAEHDKDMIANEKPQMSGIAAMAAAAAARKQSNGRQAVPGMAVAAAERKSNAHSKSNDGPPVSGIAAMAAAAAKKRDRVGETPAVDEETPATSDAATTATTAQEKSDAQDKANDGPPLSGIAAMAAAAAQKRNRVGGTPAMGRETPVRGIHQSDFEAALATNDGPPVSGIAAMAAAAAQKRNRAGGTPTMKEETPVCDIHMSDCKTTPATNDGPPVSGIAAMAAEAAQKRKGVGGTPVLNEETPLPGIAEMAAAAAQQKSSGQNTSNEGPPVSGAATAAAAALKRNRVGGMLPLDEETPVPGIAARAAAAAQQKSNGAAVVAVSGIAAMAAAAAKKRISVDETSALNEETRVPEITAIAAAAAARQESNDSSALSSGKTSDGLDLYADSASLQTTKTRRGSSSNEQAAVASGPTGPIDSSATFPIEALDDSDGNSAGVAKAGVSAAAMLNDGGYGGEHPIASDIAIPTMGVDTPEVEKAPKDELSIVDIPSYSPVTLDNSEYNNDILPTSHARSAEGTEDDSQDGCTVAERGDPDNIDPAGVGPWDEIQEATVPCLSEDSSSPACSDCFLRDGKRALSKNSVANDIYALSRTSIVPHSDWMRAVAAATAAAKQASSAAKEECDASSSMMDDFWVGDRPEERKDRQAQWLAAIAAIKTQNP